MNTQNDRNETGNEGTPVQPLIAAPIVPEAAVGPKENQYAPENQKGNSGNLQTDTLLVKYTKSLRNWTGGLVIVGGLTVAILSLQWCTFEKTDETNRVGLRPYISGIGLSADIERLP